MEIQAVQLYLFLQNNWNSFSTYSFTWICSISSCKFLIALEIVSDENICLL